VITLLACKEKPLAKDQEEIFVCDKCGIEVEENDLTCFEDTNYCFDCLDDYTFVCIECETRHLSTDDNYSCNDGPICQSCYNRSYLTCDDCGSVLHIDNACTVDDYDEANYCENCFESNRHRSIHSYNFKPYPLFYSEPNNQYDDYPHGFLMMGVENEIDEGGESNYNAQKLLEIANEAADHMYVKRDGSLKDGFELVSHPMTLKYHTQVMPWKKILSHALKLGYKSHAPGTCGLHIHVSKAAFGRNIEEREEVIGRILFFIEQFWPQLLIFSRRTEDQMKRWAARYGIKSNPKETLEQAKINYARYVALNIHNIATVEFRIFRGTLKYEVFLAALQLVDAICQAAIAISDEDLQNLTWDEFVSGVDEYSKPELINYLKNKKIFASSEAVS
jgi:hypothetical protein